MPVVSLLLATLPACSDDEEGNPATAPVNLAFTASNAAHTTGLTVPGGDAAGNPVELTDFRVSIRDVKFKLQGEDNTDLDSGEVEITGPFEIDMLDGDVAVADVLGDTVVPPGVYDGIRFVLHKSADSAAPLTDRSVYIEGTVDLGGGAQSFVMWHDTGENFDLAGTNGLIIEDGVPNDLIVDFKLVSIISAVDFTLASLAEDISPDAADSNNQQLAEALKEAIKVAADFGEDADGDGDIGEDEDVD
jgi:hypothetical protein